MAMIDKKELLDGDGMVRWEHETAYGYRYKMTLYASCNYLEFDVIRLSDHRRVYGLHHEYRQWEQAVKVFERTKADILDPGNPAHTSIQQLAEKYYPINNE